MHAIGTFTPATLTRCPRPTVTIDPFGITATYLDNHEAAIDRVLADVTLAPELRKAAARLIANMLAAAGRIALDRQLGVRATAIAGRLAATADAIPGDENVGNELLLAALRAASVRQTAVMNREVARRTHVHQDPYVWSPTGATTRNLRDAFAAVRDSAGVSP